jgi:hypothetical protein
METSSSYSIYPTIYCFEGTLYSILSFYSCIQNKFSFFTMFMFSCGGRGGIFRFIVYNWMCPCTYKVVSEIFLCKISHTGMLCEKGLSVVMLYMNVWFFSINSSSSPRLPVNVFFLIQTFCRRKSSKKKLDIHQPGI